MGRENCRDVKVTFSAKGDCHAGLPFVEVGNDSCRELARNILGKESVKIAIRAK